ncbi:hypothetical protein TPHA_0I01540 [Tetrapisispora phaffii CBS 4417]|uniref:Rho-GAP domain-containing protein n=1 Tax=Tetrapisispora phaffii (strain ATCC 24235 / CBS 4417 / NBRC 1672 / NRRL Y-8282 / UCD 70-5) TaxID=1071381 RepID=G8BXN2_TETPH|nr:hypothetical protein TPHA_0I01540 [Tetrapisispora phaffii CBS 4417]CCE64660.1 hypothetical protein TPHA_0I01540 [Tetrapisispora phaffii CBS 4417]
MSRRKIGGGSHAFDLLQAYDDHREIKDQLIKDIEQNTVPMEDERHGVETKTGDSEQDTQTVKLLEEIKMLRNTIEKKDAEILKLNRVINEYEENKMLELLPPRSLSRSKRGVDESKSVTDIEEGKPGLPSNDLDFHSPATSVAYTTSRITITSPTKIKSDSKNTNALQSSSNNNNNNNSNNRSNNNQHQHQHQHHDGTIEFTPTSKQQLTSFNDLLVKSFDGEVPAISKNVNDNNNDGMEIDEDISDAGTPDALPQPFFNRLQKTEQPPLPPQDEQMLLTPIRTSFKFDEPKYDGTNESVELSSPIVVGSDIKNELEDSIRSLEDSEGTTTINENYQIQINDSNNINGNSTREPSLTSVLSSSSNNIVTNGRINSVNSANKYRNPSNEATPNRNISNSRINTALSNQINSPNSFVNTPISVIKSDIPLFIQPNDFHTIDPIVLTTLYFNETNENFCLVSVVDKSSRKEMFKFKKTIEQIYELDSYLKSTISVYSLQELPMLPEKHSFNNYIPAKVNGRLDTLNDYFKTLFQTNNLPNNAIIKILQFISTDTFIPPLSVDDMNSSSLMKDGVLIVRKSKTLGTGINWRLRHAQLLKDMLLLCNQRNSQVLESIKLKQATIELMPNLPDDKFGTKNGFIITEQKKSTLSNPNKYYLCTEKPKERETWVQVINKLLMDVDSSGASYNGNTIDNNNDNNNYTNSTNISAKSSMQKVSNMRSITPVSRTSENSSEHIYVTDLTLDNKTFNNKENDSNLVNTESSNGSPLENKKIVTELEICSHSKKTAPNGNDDENLNKPSTRNYPSDVKFSDSSINNALEAMTLGSLEKSDSGSNFNSSFGTRNLVFGNSLDACIALSSNTYQGQYVIPSVFFRCLEYLYKNRGLQEEGVFRLSGSSSLIKLLQEKFDKEYDVDLCNFDPSTIGDGTIATRNIDVNTVTGILKLYLRSLPHLIFGDSNYQTFKNIVDENYNKPSIIAQEFRNVINSGSVPDTSIAMMYALFELLVRITQNNKINKMNLKNLCIVFSPTLNIPINILQPFIVDFGCIFKNEEPVPDSERSEVDIHIPQL